VEWSTGKLILFFIVFGIVLILFLTLIVWTKINGISPMPSSRKARREMVSAVAAVRDQIVSKWPASAGRNLRIVELGCGWGSVLRPMARKMPDCTFTGYETSPLPCLFSSFSVWILGLKNIEIIRKNFFNADLEGTDISVCYLHPEGMERLKEKLFRSPPKPLFYLVSNTFQMSGLQPDSRTVVNDLFRSAIYVYKLRLI
jgi:hypothetical protein